MPGGGADLVKALRSLEGQQLPFFNEQLVELFLRELPPWWNKASRLLAQHGNTVVNEFHAWRAAFLVVHLDETALNDHVATLKLIAVPVHDHQPQPVPLP